MTGDRQNISPSIPDSALLDERERTPVQFTLGDGRTVSVTKAIVEVVSSCNFGCQGCYMLQNTDTQKSDVMHPEDVKEIIDCFHPLSVDILGGEPLLSPYFMEIIEICVNSGVTPKLFSNLSMMNSKTAEFLLEREVYVTGKLNIGNTEDAEQLRLQARLIERDLDHVHKMIEGINTMLATGYRRPLFALENLVRKKNIHLAPAFTQWCLRNEITPALELPACSNPKYRDHFFREIAPERTQIKEAIRRLERVCKESGNGMKWLPPHIVGEGICTFKCEGLYFSKKNGRLSMQPCSSNTTDLGYLDGYQSVVSAFEHPIMVARKTLDSLYIDGSIEGPCGQCDRFFGLCRGGCRATAENIGGLNSSYPLCWKVR